MQLLDKINAKEDGSSQILIVDDTVFNIQIQQMILLSNYKITADQAISGEEALVKCQQKVSKGVDAYKFIIMDINMPGMDGVETTQKIREIFDPYVKKRGQKDYIIVAHTALPEDQFGDYATRGFDGFMPKPINKTTLSTFLQRVNMISTD
mmetsp:Transcript_1203/g.2201  ORF Transcript_1203/g.2201 Transcript_1203/m.2201 type:complete len:151 (+) Transcript_1203:305-757(+)